MWINEWTNGPQNDTLHIVANNIGCTNPMGDCCSLSRAEVQIVNEFFGNLLTRYVHVCVCVFSGGKFAENIYCSRDQPILRRELSPINGKTHHNLISTLICHCGNCTPCGDQLEFVLTKRCEIVSKRHFHARHWIRIIISDRKLKHYWDSFNYSVKWFRIIRDCSDAINDCFACTMLGHGNLRPSQRLHHRGMLLLLTDPVVLTAPWHEITYICCFSRHTHTKINIL